MKLKYILLYSGVMAFGLLATSSGLTTGSSGLPTSTKVLEDHFQTNILRSGGDEERKPGLGYGFDSRTGMVTALSSDAYG